MFARRTNHNDSFSKHRAGKSVSTSKGSKRSFTQHATAAKKMEKSRTKKPESPSTGR